MCRSRDLFEQNDGHHLALEPIAGLALLCLAQDDHAGARAEVEKILDHLSGGGDLHGTEEPFRIRLSCYEVLDRIGDERAQRTLTDVYSFLQAQAAQIPDVNARKKFLNDVPHHRKIVAAWNQRSVNSLPSPQ